MNPHMSDLYCSLMAVVLTDPAAVRALVEQLQRLPAAVRINRAAPVSDADPGLADLESAEVWREMARDE